MSEGLLRIGQLARQARVSPRTVDFYTGLGLLVPERRTAGNFRLYHPADVRRIGLIRQLEAQGIRLEDIARALTRQNAAEDAAEDAETSAGRADPGALPGHLTFLEEQVRVLRELAARADPRTREVVAALTARAQALIATAVVLGSELVGDVELPQL